MVDRCVICGEPVPEGQQVCWTCIEKTVVKPVDKVAVVRCRDCFFSSWNPCSETLRCTTRNGMGPRAVSGEDYCSYGKQKGR